MFSRLELRKGRLYPVRYYDSLVCSIQPLTFTVLIFSKMKALDLINVHERLLDINIALTSYAVP